MKNPPLHSSNSLTDENDESAREMKNILARDCTSSISTCSQHALQQSITTGLHTWIDGCTCFSLLQTVEFAKRVADSS